MIFSDNLIIKIFSEPRQCGMCDQQSLRSACAYVQSVQSFCLSLEYSMTVKLMAEHHLEFLSLKGGYTGSSKSTLIRMLHCVKYSLKILISYTITPYY